MLVIQRTLDSRFHLLVSNDFTSHKLGVSPFFSGTPMSLIKLFAYHQRILIVSPFHPPSIPIPSISPFCLYSWFKSLVYMCIYRMLYIHVYIYVYIYMYTYIYIYAHAEYFPIFGQFNHIRPSIFPVVETFQPITKIEDMVVTHFEITNEIVPSYSCSLHSQDSIYIYIYVLPCFPDSNLLLFVGTLWLWLT